LVLAISTRKVQRKQETKGIELLTKELTNSKIILSDITKINYNCTLGDITQDPKYYQIALDLAESSRQLPKSRAI
jgi:hypothetical protein